VHNGDHEKSISRAHKMLLIRQSPVNVSYGSGMIFTAGDNNCALCISLTAT